MESHIAIWDPVRINRSSRPILEEDEHTIHISDNVGIYQGKAKIVGRQQGRLYLTNRRIIYFDNANNSNSLAIDLQKVESCAAVDGFLRSSPKVKVFIRDLQEPTQTISKLVTWYCKICSYGNQIKSDFNLDGEMPKCTSCGIPCSKNQIQEILQGEQQTETPPPPVVRDDQCSSCTFINHPSMKYCEICGAELKSSLSPLLKAKFGAQQEPPQNKLGLVLEGQEIYTGNKPYIKFSFRKGGEDKFKELLTGALEDVLWERLERSGAVNKNATKVNKNDEVAFDKNKSGGGILVLEKLSENRRQHNEKILSSSLEDLEMLMFKFQDLIKLSDSFKKFVKASLHTPNVYPIAPLNIKKSSNLYHQELARHISEFLTSTQLTMSSSIVTAQEGYAYYNRYLTSNLGLGTELVSPEDFRTALMLFEELNLPVELRIYKKSALSVLGLRQSNEDSYQQFIIDYLKDQQHQYVYQKLKEEASGTSGDSSYYCGKTISEISNWLHWSIGITTEEISKCIDSGRIAIDQNISGTFYFISIFGTDIDQEAEDKRLEEMKASIQQELSLEQQSISEMLRKEYVETTTNQLINFGKDYKFALPESTQKEHKVGAVPAIHDDLNGLSFS